MNDFDEIITQIGESPYTAVLALLLTVIPFAIWFYNKTKHAIRYLITTSRIGLKAQRRRRQYRLAAEAVRNSPRSDWQVFQAVFAAWLTLRVVVQMLYASIVYFLLNLALPSLDIGAMSSTFLYLCMVFVLSVPFAMVVIESTQYQNVRKARIRFNQRRKRDV